MTRLTTLALAAATFATLAGCGHPVPVAGTAVRPNAVAAKATGDDAKAAAVLKEAVNAAEKGMTSLAGDAFKKAADLSATVTMAQKVATTAYDTGYRSYPEYAYRKATQLAG